MIFGTYRLSSLTGRLTAKVRSLIFGRPRLSASFLAGGIVSTVNIADSENLWLQTPSSVASYSPFQECPFRFIINGLITPFPLEWLGYLIVASFVISRNCDGRVKFWKSLLICLFSFALVIVVWEIVSSSLQDLYQAKLH
jgi:hypothetical protein